MVDEAKWAERERMQKLADNAIFQPHNRAKRLATASRRSATVTFTSPNYKGIELDTVIVDEEGPVDQTNPAFILEQLLKKTGVVGHDPGVKQFIVHSPHRAGKSYLQEAYRQMAEKIKASPFVIGRDGSTYMDGSLIIHDEAGQPRVEIGTLDSRVWTGKAHQAPPHISAKQRKLRARIEREKQRELDAAREALGFGDW